MQGWSKKTVTDSAAGLQICYVINLDFKLDSFWQEEIKWDEDNDKMFMAIQIPI